MYARIARTAFVLLLGIGGWSEHCRAAEKPPNIVLILADDLGVECVESYGGRSYRTPHIDALAASGVRFTHGFANPYCSPSRAQLLTGRYPLHNGITRVIYDPQQHREWLDPARETSFATLLRDAGYATAIAGKWQVSFLHERDIVREHGFDEYQLWQIFHNGQKTSRYASPTMRQNGKVLHEELRGRYGPEVNLEFLIDFIRRHRDGPFLAHYAALLPHQPWEPTPDSGVPLRPAEGAGDPKYMPDMVAYLDKQVGQLLDVLEELGIRQNTLVLFTADNGTDRRIRSRWTDGRTERTVAGGKGTMTDAGTRVPLIASWPEATAGGRVCEDLIDLSDFLPTLAEVGRAGPPPRPINGRSFAPQLRGKRGNPRDWIHVQDKSQRHVRNRDFLLNDQRVLRPVTEIGEAPAPPVTGPRNEAQRAAARQLRAALDAAAQLPSGR